jgi:hypothetical protein
MRRWKNNIKMDLQEIKWGGMEWIDLVQDREGWRALLNPHPVSSFHLFTSYLSLVLLSCFMC